MHVPQITKNLVSVQKFTFDTNTFFEFHLAYFLLKDWPTRKLLLYGLSRHGLYSFPSSHALSAPSAFLGELTSLDGWHSRLGHPAFKVASRIVSPFGLPVYSNKGHSSCPACLSSKSKQFPSSNSITRVTKPLELIYTDVWAPPPLFVQLMDSSIMFLFWMHILIILGSFLFLAKVMFIPFFKIFNCKLNVYLIVKLKLFNQIGG